MAKWGEGDPRWIVEERPDATNVNNWHWTEKNAAHWSKEKLKALLTGLEVDDPNIGKCSITEVTSIEGEAVANNRKGKLIFFYEWVIKCQWKGYVNGESEEIIGQLEVPNLSEENRADEITTIVTLESPSAKGDIVKELMRTKGLSLVQQQINEYIIALRNEFAKDMIKPTKYAEGGSINSFQTEVQLKKDNSNYVPVSNSSQQKSASTTTSKPLGVKIETASLRLVEHFKCTAEELYRVFTDPNLLQAFTQNKVQVDPVVGGQFSLLDGNIIGKFSHLEPNKCIKQSWRIKNWPMEHYSEVNITMEQKEDHTELLLAQSGVPRSELERTEEGWKRHYFESIKRIFGFGSSIF